MRAAKKSVDKRNHGALALFLSCAMLASAGAAQSEIVTTEFFDTSGGRAPLSNAVRVGDILYLSGALGTRDGKLVEGGAAAETEQAIENIKSLLAEHNLTVSDVVKCTVFITDMADFGIMNDAYKEAFLAPRPARSAVGVKSLVYDANVEIECIAAF